MVNKLKVIIQCILGLTPLIISIVLPIELLWEFLSLVLDRDFNDLKEIVYGIVPYKKFISLVLGFILTVFVFSILRLINKNKTFNIGSGYFDYPMIYFFLASRILGYGKITLVRVPLYLQFKLLFKDIFDCIDSDTHPEVIDEPRVVTLNSVTVSNEINLILSDTYQIHLGDLPFEKRRLPTVLIERATGFSGVRTYNQRFTAVIREQTNKYRLQYKRVNIFATTNTQHTKEIVLQCFKNGGRTGFKKIYVYEQNADYKFEKSHVIE